MKRIAVLLLMTPGDKLTRDRARIANLRQAIFDLYRSIVLEELIIRAPISASARARLRDVEASITRLNRHVTNIENKLYAHSTRAAKALTHPPTLQRKK